MLYSLVLVNVTVFLAFTPQVGAALWSTNAPLILNEVVFNPPGSDTSSECEYVELQNGNNKDVTGTFTYLDVEGDSSQNPGFINYRRTISDVKLGPHAIVVIASSKKCRILPKQAVVIYDEAMKINADNNDGTNSFLVISGTVPEVTDLDVNNDGILDVELDVYDSVAVSDGGAGDVLFGTLLPTPPDIPEGQTSDAATRFLNRDERNNACAWYWGDLSGASNTQLYTTNAGSRSANFPANTEDTEIRLTPGKQNKGDGTCGGTPTPTPTATPTPTPTPTPTHALSILSGSDFVTVNQGAAQNVVNTINLIAPSGVPVNVTNTVTIAPDNGGLTITSDYPSGGYNTSSGNTTFVLNQSFTGVTPGTYVVTNTATITGSNPPITSSDTITVEVIPPGGNPIILPVGANPDGVMFNTPTLVTFTASVTNFQTAPAALSLRRVDGANNPVVGTLLDDGNNPDLEAGDGVFSGSIIVNEPTEGLAKFRASGFFPGVSGERFSDDFSLVVTCFSTKPAPSDPTKIVVDPGSGVSMFSNEILVSFAAGTTCSEMSGVASLIGGTIVGTQPGLGLFQIRFAGNATAQGVYDALATVQSSPKVAQAAPIIIGQIDEVTPNDSDYSLQYAPAKIRADEAWVVARGGPVIAVVDTGVDYNHPDLAGKVIKGHDYVNGDNDPLDDQSHGTHVTGIAAANSNNGQGVAGISWKSKVLAIKVFDSNGSGSALNAAAGIKEAADSGAKVINCSFGFGFSGLASVFNLYYQLIFNNAVNYATAKGSIVVVSAGNENTTAFKYPCLSSSSFCVGSTDSSDNRSSFSSFGAAVDIAAPGSSIWSTIPGSYGSKSGTSMAAPAVAGSVAVVRSYFPSWTAGQVIERLQKTAAPITPDHPLGSGRVDLFEAVFNGSFEDNTNGWKVTGTAGAVTQLGPLSPTNRQKLGFLSSGPDAAQVQTTLEQTFTIQPDVTSFVLKFDYDFVSEEYPEFVNQGFNDNMRITLVKPDGTTQQLAFESIDGSPFTLIGGIDFPGGDTTVGHTGFKTISVTIPVTAGPGVYRIVVRDEGDGIYDSQVLIDNIRFK